MHIPVPSTLLLLPRSHVLDRPALLDSRPVPPSLLWIDHSLLIEIIVFLVLHLNDLILAVGRDPLVSSYELARTLSHYVSLACYNQWMII